ncbi:MAG: pirin family protein, partial [Candidatus Thermoplasmatota archaeon]|nr:pirin family protein [Candidatus Thermoplasmatota archaeon]
LTDPFLLLDHFGSSDPAEYMAGFPWHPHRGIETVTFLMEGKVEHQDSEGHRGTIYPNDIQWMTAGSGIFHQEMPHALDDRDPSEIMRSTGMSTSVVGLQLWINLPSKYKMTTPTYRGITGKITPVVEDDSGNRIRIVAGKYLRDQGYLMGRPEIDPVYLEVKMPPESEFRYTVENGHNSIINTLSGDIRTGRESTVIHPRSAVVFSQENDTITVKTGDRPARFILLAGKPIREPIFWYGPMVMNTREEINQALQDLQNNTFIREKNPITE